MKIKCYGAHCYKQGIKHEREELTKFENKNYCQKCLPEVRLHREQYKHLISFLQEKYRISYPTPIMLSQIKQFNEKYNYSYPGMESALEYMSDVKRKPYDIHYGLGYIRFIYEEAQTWKLETQSKNGRVKTHVSPASEMKVSLFKKRRNLGLISEESLLE